MALPTKSTAPAKKETRRYPRSSVKLKAKIAVIGDRGKKSSLEAVLGTSDLSITGVFIESTFFMKVGTQVQVEFVLPKDPRPVVVNGYIVREERPGVGGRGVRTGFAVHFTDFVQDSAVVLAALFLAPRVKKFVEKYMKDRRDAELRSELDRLIDVVVGWELAKTQHEDVWTTFG